MNQIEDFKFIRRYSMTTKKTRENYFFALKWKINISIKRGL